MTLINTSATQASAVQVSNNENSATNKPDGPATTGTIAQRLAQALFNSAPKSIGSGGEHKHLPQHLSAARHEPSGNHAKQLSSPTPQRKADPEGTHAKNILEKGQAKINNTGAKAQENQVDIEPEHKTGWEIISDEFKYEWPLSDNHRNMTPGASLLKTSKYSGQNQKKGTRNLNLKSNFFKEQRLTTREDKSTRENKILFQADIDFDQKSLTKSKTVKSSNGEKITYTTDKAINLKKRIVAHNTSKRYGVTIKNGEIDKVYDQNRREVSDDTTGIPEYIKNLHPKEKKPLY